MMFIGASTSLTTTFTSFICFYLRYLKSVWSKDCTQGFVSSLEPLFWDLESTGELLTDINESLVSLKRIKVDAGGQFSITYSAELDWSIFGLSSAVRSVHSTFVISAMLHSKHMTNLMHHSLTDPEQYSIVSFLLTRKLLSCEGWMRSMDTGAPTSPGSYRQSKHKIQPLLV